MSTIPLNNLSSLMQIFGGNCVPPEGPVAIPVVLAFSSTAQEFVADLTITQQQHKISYIQSIYVDNSENAFSLDVFVQATQHLVTIPPFHQGFVSLLSSNPPQISFVSLVSADTRVVVQLLNFPVSNIIWNTDPSFTNRPINVTDPILDALLVNGYLPVHDFATAPTNRSGTITAGGTSQTVMVANTARIEAWVANPSALAESLYINIYGAAAVVGQGIEIPPGTGWSGQITSEIRVIAATTGHVFTAGER